MADVGGTTTDVGVVRDGSVRTRRRGTVAGVPVSFELSEIESHGVGGSSVIQVLDKKIQVGPISVGAAPGPACFGLGGSAATITDVYLLMGVLDPGTYLGGTMRLDAERSRRAVQNTVAEPLGLSVDEALLAMEAAYATRVAEALRTEELDDDTVVAAFGGAGPMSACGAADLADVKHIIVPRMAAGFSAFGIRFSHITQNYEHPLTSLDSQDLDAALAALRTQAARDMAAERFDLKDCRGEVAVLAERG